MRHAPNIDDLGTMVALAVQLDSRNKQIESRDKLILWLSKTYNGNDPTFPFYGLDGELLQENVTLYRTWCLVVRGIDSEIVDLYIKNLLKP